MSDIATTAEPVRYRLLGLVAVHSSSTTPSSLASKPRAVLAALLLHANQIVADEHLLDLVWGPERNEGAKHRLYNYVSELRARLGAKTIARAGSGYLITVLPGELDLQVFTDEVAEAHTELRGARYADAARRLRAALALWTGPALAGVTNSLIARERPTLEERRLTALEELFDAELAAGRHSQIVDELGKIASENPRRERLAAQLMLALYRCGRRGEALAVYTDTRRRLVDELGVEPGQQLREMQLRILNAEDEPVEPSLERDQTDSRDAPRADGLQQIRPFELPRDIAGFAGRKEALALLDTRLTTEAGGVCVISGIGGVGKTALAVHWAHSARGHFPDGQLYLNLRCCDPERGDVLTPLAALGNLLRSLGVPAPRIPSTQDDCEALYRSLTADRKMLLVLDNACGAAQVLPLLPSAGSVVVTSRFRLNDLVVHAGADLLALTALTDQESHGLLRAMLGTDRVAEEDPSVAQLVELCAGLPLALRIAAANIATSLATDPASTIDSVVGELTGIDRLAALTLVGAEDSPIVSAFAASYQGLKPAQQHMFRLLGLVPGPDFTGPTAAALAGIPLDQATRHLKALASACLVEQHVSGRYRFHDLIRLYAADRMREEAYAPHAWDRLVDHYLRAVTTATQGYGHGTVRLRRPTPLLPEHAGAPDQQPVDPELPNVTSAALLALQRGPYPAVWLLVGELRTYYQRTGRRAEWLQVAPAFLDAARAQDELDVQALLHLSLGTSMFQNGWPGSGLRHLEDAIRLSRECDWPECEAAALTDFGVALSWASRPAEALAPTRRALDLFVELGSVAGENRALNNLSGHHHFLGRLREADEYCRAALVLSERHGLRFAQAGDLMDLGSLRISENRLDEATELLERAQRIFTELRSAGGLAYINARLSQLYWQRGDFQRAVEEAQAALEYSLKTGALLYEATGRTLLANAQIRLGEYPVAAENLDAVMRIVDVRPNDLGWHRTKALAALARLETARGHPRSGIDLAKQARAVAQNGGYLLVEAAAMVVLTEAYLSAGETEHAGAISREALDLSERAELAILRHDIERLHEQTA